MAEKCQWKTTFGSCHSQAKEQHSRFAGLLVVVFYFIFKVLGSVLKHLTFFLRNESFLEIEEPNY